MFIQTNAELESRASNLFAQALRLNKVADMETLLNRIDEYMIETTHAHLIPKADRMNAISNAVKSGNYDMMCVLMLHNLNRMEPYSISFYADKLVSAIQSGTFKQNNRSRALLLKSADKLLKKSTSPLYYAFRIVAGIQQNRPFNIYEIKKAIETKNEFIAKLGNKRMLQEPAPNRVANFDKYCVLRLQGKF